MIDQEYVLGHSGVWRKSAQWVLWNLHCILKLKLAEASKQRTTYFAEMYDLSFSWCIIDTPRIKVLKMLSMEPGESGYFSWIFSNWRSVQI
jgi:putative ribosome biogenesis GTPase RsgA